MGKESHHPLSIPERADNAEESVKCPSCGTMIQLGYTEDDDALVCPICQEQVTADEEYRLYSSNEDY